MILSRLGAALLVLAASSYASAAVPEGLIGAAMPKGGSGAAARQIAPGLPSSAGGAARSGAQASRYSTVLGGLQPEGRAATRGAKEAKVYQSASPAVVLVVSEDSLGSGALISVDGKIITNLHVVGEADEVGVIFKPAVEGGKISEADVRRAKVIRRDEVADLALIQVEEVPANIAPLQIGAASDVEVGSDVHAIGHPTGQTWTYTQGIVSQIRRDSDWKTEDRIPHKATLIQTQTPINPGNSGGPLIDDDLKLIGVNSFTGEGEGLNFAVSADDVTAFLDRPEDRMIAPEAKKAATDCEFTTLKSWRSDDPPADRHLVDTDCDGQGDVVAEFPDDPKKPLLLLGDANGDGKTDVIIIDEKRDGQFDLALYDTDYDGKIDMEGHFRKGEDEPYKFTRVKN